MSTVYIVHWSNVEEIYDMGAECFFKYEEAYSFLTKMIEKNYPEGHFGELEYEDICLNTPVDPEALFPYLYMISQKTVN